MRNQTFMRRVRGRVGAFAAVAILMPTLTACDSFFEVINPNVIDASTVDPVADGTVFSRSAFQTLAQALGNYIVYSAWFTNEAWVGDTFPTRNEFGRRLVDDRSNGDLNGTVFFPLARSISQSEQVVEILDGTAGQELNVARAALASGFGILLQGSAFCEGTIPGPGNEPGPLMTAQQLLEASLPRFDKAISAGGATTGAEAASIVTAAKVGKGRALLQLGRKAEAAAAVSGVATSFAFNMPYVDDASNRGRLGNGVYSFSAGGTRESLVVPPHYRDMNDSRIAWQDAGRNAQDGVLRFYTQRKFAAWNAPIRLASGLEARYIEIEAGQNAAAMLAFVNERRAAGGQAAVNTANVTELMGYLMDQRSRDFWLEGVRIADWHRNPNAVPNILQPGNTYYKPEVGTVSNQTCFPLPFAERNSNPNMGG